MNQFDNTAFYERLEIWFDAYISAFRRQYPHCRDQFNLKREHSHSVSCDITSIAEAIGLDPADRALAKIIGLLHDIGRFSQMADYNTFNDQYSVDHGVLGATIIREKDMLSPMDSADQIVVQSAVSHHNKATLPDLRDDRCHFFAKLIRDADKLDIFRVIRDNYHIPSALDSLLPSGQDISEHVFADVLKKDPVCKGHVKNQIDWIFFRIGWLFDINFTPTIELIIDRGYYAILRSMLPKTENIVTALNAVDDFLERAHLFGD